MSDLAGPECQGDSSESRSAAPRPVFEYPAKFRDRHGEEPTAINNVGRTLTMVVRGVEFSSQRFDNWTPPAETSAEMLANFVLRSGELTGFNLQCQMPLLVMRGATPITVILDIEVNLGEADERGRIDRETVQLTLVFDGADYRSVGDFGHFEDALLSLQRALPAETYLKTCFTCAYSDYSPGGIGLFGCLACFRDNKSGYLAAGHDKASIFRVWPTMTELVQETWLCPEFERRQPGTGYRG